MFNKMSVEFLNYHLTAEGIEIVLCRNGKINIDK